MVDGGSAAGHSVIMNNVPNSVRVSVPTAPEGLMGLAAGLLLVTTAVLVGQLAHPAWGATATVLLFLPPVLVSARYSGLGPALAVSVIATLTFDFFFTEPYHSLRIESPADMLTAGAFLLVALTISRLASTIRTEAKHAAQKTADQAAVADLARQLIICTDQKAVVQTAVTHLARLFDAQALFAVDGGRPAIIVSQPAKISLAPNEEAALVTTLALGRTAGRSFQRVSHAEWQFNPVIVAGKVVGAIGLARCDGAPPVPAERWALLQSLLDQVALALERAIREAEAHAALVAREREKFQLRLRTSISEDIKPHVHAIRSELKRIRRNAGDKEAASAIASEAAMLRRSVDHLGDLGSVDDLEPVICGKLRIDLFRHQVTREGAAVHLTPKEFAVLAELARNAGRVLTHRQLLRAVWGPKHEKDIDYLRVAIRALRQKLEDEATKPALIVNEPAVGYRLSLAESRLAVAPTLM